MIRAILEEKLTMLDFIAFCVIFYFLGWKLRHKWLLIAKLPFVTIECLIASVKHKKAMTQYYKQQAEEFAKRNQ